LDKSSIHFAKGCRQDVRDDIKEILNVQKESLNEKYLGMPFDVGSSVNGAFKYLKGWVWKRVQGWMEMCLSTGGKEVLIKSVAQAIPTYSMSFFRLPRDLCQHINGLMRNFWWGSKEGKRKPCWVAWEEMVKPKFFGGLGFRDIELFNLALLAKQAWGILEDASSLSARILEDVYFPECDFLEVERGSAPSRIWRAILDRREVLEWGLIRRIGTGETINIWDMNWIPRKGRLCPVRRVLPRVLMLVSELFDATFATWDRQKLQAHLVPADVEAILNIPLCIRR
jgi:hypothetical protein